MNEKEVNLPVFKKEHARDFCLPHIEAWCKGESTDPRVWTDKQQPYNPYILFEKTEDTVNCYMDPRGFNWIQDELKNQLKKDQKFVEKIVKKYFEVYGKTQESWEKEKTLSHEELAQFIQNYQEGWSLYEAIYFLAGMLPENTEEFNLVKKALTFTDTAGDKGDRVIRRSLKKIFPELDELSSVLLIEEIFFRKFPPKTELEKRMKKYFYANDTLWVDKTLEDIEKIFRIKIEKITEDIRELRGQVGFKGSVKGVVRKIMSYSQANELKEGEILVTAMTTPEFLPALKRASAFITDEGGIMSHAAIVSREFNIPCIIGTKVATQVLKNGDLIEVDANHGVVRIIQHS